MEQKELEDADAFKISFLITTTALLFYKNLSGGYI